MDTRITSLSPIHRILEENLKRLVTLALLTIVLFAAGCAGHGGTGLPTFINGSVTDAEYEAASAAITQAFQDAGSGSDVTEKVLAAMRAQEKVVVARLNSSDQPVAWFKDGRKLIVLVDSLLRAPAESVGSGLTAVSREGATRNLVSGKKAVFMNGFLGAGVPNLEPLRAQLADKGFEVQVETLTAETGPSLAGLDLLLASSHALVDESRTGVKKLFYGSTTEVTRETSQLYRQQIADEKMVEVVTRIYSGPRTYETKVFYGLSQAYLQERGMSFRPGAFWLSNACHSARQPAIAFADTIPGLTCYTGWNGAALNITADETTAFVFDRLLGVFAATPTDPAPPGPLTTPELKERLTVVRSTGGLRMDQSRNTKDIVVDHVVHRPSGAAQANQTLIPSIRSATLNATEETVTIDGFFGTQQGPVTLNGTIQNVLSWGETSIVIDKPGEKSGTLLVRSIGAPSASGFLFSNSFRYQEPEPFSITISPEIAITTPDTIRSLTAVAATGTIPANSRFRWTVTSGGGKVNGKSTVTGSEPTVEYRSAPEVGTDVLKLDVLNQAGQVIASKTLTITISQQVMAFTVAGGWDPSKAPPNGSYSYFDGGSSYDDESSGLARILFASSNIGATDQTIGALLTIGLARGETVQPGTWTKVGTGQQVSAGLFQLTLSTNQTNPDDLNSKQVAMGDSGTLTVSKVSTLSNGRTAFTYTFSVARAAGGTVTGSGTGIITPL